MSTKTLYLAEKPSQAMDIARVLGIKARKDGYLELANGDVFTWAVGHLLELAEPAKYQEAWGGRWSWAQLPMIPDAWKYEVNSRTRKQFTVIKALLKDVGRVVIATDAGREGELIAREVLDYCRFRGAIQRLWTSSLVDTDIRKALASLKADKDTRPLYEAALARSRGDWLLGLSGTRAATLAAGVRGDYFAMGRVKTPTLAMVVRRCELVEGFAAKQYFELEATAVTQQGQRIKLVHAPSEEDRLTTLEQANTRLARAKDFAGPLQVSVKEERESPPLPYSLPALQKDANKALGFSAKKTLKTAQALYEKKAATYPRTDCQYLAESQIDEIPAVLKALEGGYSREVALVQSMGVTARKTTFNNAKLTDHHGIIPTVATAAELTEDERALYNLVCMRYLRTVAPDHRYEQTRVSVDANGVVFKAAGRRTLSPGWVHLGR